MSNAAMKKRTTGKESGVAAKGSRAKTGMKVGKPPEKVGRPAKTGKFLSGKKERFTAVMAAAERSGLMGEKSGRIAGRVSPALIEQAKKQTGIHSDTDLLEFALAHVALKDDFPEAFRKLKGTVDSTLDLEF